MEHQFYKNTVVHKALILVVSLFMATGMLLTVGLKSVSAMDTIYLSDEGWSVPVGTWDSVTKTGTLTQDISNSIVINSDYIILDGNGYSISGDGTGNGVYVESQHHITIMNLTITNKLNGIRLYKTHTSIIENNTISNTERGIYLYEVAYVSIVNNHTFGNSNTGISIRAYSHHNLIENNLSNLNRTGIKFEGGFFNTVRNNDFQDNTTNGLVITDDWGFIGSTFVRFVTDNNTIYNNNFINNHSQAYIYTWLVGENNAFYLDLPIGGNYWSNWVSPDENHDGNVDNPYVVNGVVDNLPWTTLNGWLNQPPTSDAGGPYSVILGNTAIFDGSGSYDPDVATGDSIVSYEWDIAGIYTLVGIAPTLSVEEIEDLGVGVHLISLKTTDSHGVMDTDNTTLEILPPQTTVLQQAEALLIYFDEEVINGSLAGIGPGRSSQGRLGALRNMLEAVCELIEDEQFDEARLQLLDVYMKVDGNPQPPDFVAGDAVEEISTKILELIEVLSE
jgi:parallel beta-helix repeat protein